jgi:hypothetical protein
MGGQGGPGQSHGPPRQAPGQMITA